MKEQNSTNRLELETQILSAALRKSIKAQDHNGTLASAQELFYLYPDLAPPPDAENLPKENYYDLFSVELDADPKSILAAYFKSIKNSLREKKVPRDEPNRFLKLLNAGIVLRKHRLRLSHDLALAGLEMQNESIAIVNASLPEAEDRPKFLRAMLTSCLISSDELQALLNQMQRYPNIPLEDLVAQAGYLTEPEFKSCLLVSEFWDRIVDDNQEHV